MKGVTEDGFLTDADPLEAELKAAIVSRAPRRVLAVSRSKLGARGLNEICHLRRSRL